MCTADTKKLQESRERCNFFTNQILTEVNRVGENNGHPMIEHFVSQAQMQVEYIENAREVWQEFISYFSSGDPTMFDTDEEVEPDESMRETEVKEDRNEMKRSGIMDSIKAAVTGGGNRGLSGSRRGSLQPTQPDKS